MDHHLNENEPRPFAALGDANRVCRHTESQDIAPSNVSKILSRVSTTTSECAHNIGQMDGVCSTENTVGLIADFVQEQGGARKEKKSADIIHKAAELLKCPAESCILTHPLFRQYLQVEQPRSLTLVDRELEQRFKSRGPRDNRDLLDNANIDGTLRQWAQEFSDFFNCPFAMIDFEETHSPLASISMAGVYNGTEPQSLGVPRAIRRPCKTFACVVNTDRSTGRGKHWVVVFVDMRDRALWTVEYFNSSGNPPPKTIVRWMESTAKELRKLRTKKDGLLDPFNSVTALPVTRILHQHSRTECGPYTLFYIRMRLEGESYTFFSEDRVPDEAMGAFRQHLFRK